MKLVVMARRVRVTPRSKNAHAGRMALCPDGRCIVLSRTGNVLFNGTQMLWRQLVSLGFAAGGGE